MNDLAFDFDCLGCLMAARDSGQITQGEYDEIIAMWDEVAMQQWGRCPRCGKQAYISEYEPDIMHCSACGLYSFRNGSDGEWFPAMQGAVHER